MLYASNKLEEKGKSITVIIAFKKYLGANTLNKRGLKNNIVHWKNKRRHNEMERQSMLIHWKN